MPADLKIGIICGSGIEEPAFISDFNSYKGNAYGLANTLFQTAFLKPKIKNSKLNNLYYTGQLTVPGPGMPPALVLSLIHI